MFVIQDPTNEQSHYLLESLLDAFHEAEKVAGAFAYASSAGVHLLTEDNAFQEVARNHSVDLVVGIDAVTNDRALDSLTQVCEEYPNVQVRAFFNPRPEALFHPKFCWTKNRNGGHLITGSGNLTEAGLLGNWEAYSVQQLDESGTALVESTWNNWTANHQASLLPLDDADVRNRASANNILAREGDLPTLVATPTPPAPEEEPVTTQLMPPTAVVLVAELPKNRPGQANFHLDDYVNYFGVQKRIARLVIFRHVNADGTMDEYERDRRAVIAKSGNFRFELAASSRVAYPNHGRPIAVFVRMGPRTFLYRYLLPEDPEYLTVTGLLEQRAGTASRPMRAVRMTVAELRQEWPNSPFWKLPATD